MQWILVVSMAGALATSGLAATDAQCIGILQLALDAAIRRRGNRRWSR